MIIHVWDSGPLIALEKNNRQAWALFDAVSESGDTLEVPAGVIGQVWRGGPRQARLGQALKKCRAVPMDEAVARSAGVLCELTGTSDVIDASVAVTATMAASLDSVVVTSDVSDIQLLLDHARERSDSANSIEIVEL